MFIEVYNNISSMTFIMLFSAFGRSLTLLSILYNTNVLPFIEKAITI